MSGDRRAPHNIYAGDAGYFKICSKCDVAKLLVCFNAKTRNEDGKRSFCRECQNSFQRDYSNKNKEKLNRKNLAWRHANPEKAKASSLKSARKRCAKGHVKDYALKHAEHLNIKKKEWWKRYPEKRKQYNDKQFASVKGKIEAAVRVSIRSEICRGSKNGRKTFHLLGYSSSQLMSHLESLFTDGMSWENYGRGGWHIDHIRPLSSFSYMSPDDKDFREAWALSNLQPLWQIDNLKKGNRMVSSLRVVA